MSTTKHELLNGEILAMAGGSPEHALLANNAPQALTPRLRGRCFVFSSDARIHVPPTGFYTYPDLSVVCGPVQRHQRDPNSIVNPRLLVEVLSDSAEDYDLGEKFRQYCSIPTLDTYVTLSHREPLVRLHEKRGDRSWSWTEYRGIETSAPLAHFDLALPLTELYADFESLRAGG